MPTQTITVKVDKAKVKQFTSVIEQLGYAEVQPAKSVAKKKSNIQKGKFPKGEKISDAFKRLGGTTRYENFEDLRKDAWAKKE